MNPPKPPTWLVLALGVALGWTLATPHRPPLLAQDGGSWWPRIQARLNTDVAVGPIATQYNPRQRVQIAQDALYYLDYKGGRLLATVPALRKIGTSSHLLDEFAERDLVADFQIAPGIEPNFRMVTGTLGALSEGWAPLFVFETVTGQVAAYRVQAQMVGDRARPRFEMLDRRPIRQGPLPAPAS